MLLKQINNRVFFIAAYIFISINLYSQVSKENIIKLPIKEAIDKNMLDLNISGAGDPRVYLEIIDKDGVHYGKCMSIVLKS